MRVTSVQSGLRHAKGQRRDELMRQLQVLHAEHMKITKNTMRKDEEAPEPDEAPEHPSTSSATMRTRGCTRSWECGAVF